MNGYDKEGNEVESENDEDEELYGDEEEGEVELDEEKLRILKENG